MATYSPMGLQQPIVGYTASAAAQVTITTASTATITANEDTGLIFIANTGNQDVFLGIGATAVVDTGLFIARGDSVFLPMHGNILEAINAITAFGSTTLSIQVWT